MSIKLTDKENEKLTLQELECGEKSDKQGNEKFTWQDMKYDENH